MASSSVPSVSITIPSNGAIFAPKTTVTITANASDDVGVKNVKFYINGSLKCTDTTAPYSCVWKLGGGKNKSYKLEASASDLANNVSTSTVSVSSSN